MLDVDRDDVQLADWFSGAPVAPGEDDVFTRTLENGRSQSLRFVPWSEAAELRELALDVIAEELNLAGRDDIDGFARSLGGYEYEGRIYFHRGRGCADAAEAWLILSPVRGLTHGVPRIVYFLRATPATLQFAAAVSRAGHKSRGNVI